MSWEPLAALVKAVHHDRAVINGIEGAEPEGVRGVGLM